MNQDKVITNNTFNIVFDTAKNLTKYRELNFCLNFSGIPPHVDTHSAFEDAIVSLSLASDIVMEFRKASPTNGKEYVDHVSVSLPRRSLLIMSGESRYGWKHGITPRKIDVIRDADGHLTTKFRSKRISYTFRW